MSARILSLGLVMVAVVGSLGISRAQDAAVAQEDAHPLVGTWRWENDPADLADDSFGTFHADGGYIEVTANVGTALGAWEAAGERAGDIIFVFQDVDPSLEYAPGFGTFQLAAELDQSGDRLSATGSLVAQAPDGTALNEFEGWTFVATRLEVGMPVPFLAPAAGTPVAAAPAAPTDADLIRDLERERLRAVIEADLEAADRLHADDFQVINPFGQALSRDEYLGGIESGGIDFLVFEPISAIEVRLSGEAAAIRYQMHIEVNADGEQLDFRGWNTNVYKYQDGRWQAVWSQITMSQ
ncbi:MAG: nuclear transport factor 2 family protein [Chloroflexota bacterium]|nr:nuclear transport factor 2 family protein [Chloroflexota bacterium]